MAKLKIKIQKIQKKNVFGTKWVVGTHDEIRKIRRGHSGSLFENGHVLHIRSRLAQRMGNHEQDALVYCNCSMHFVFRALRYNHEPCDQSGYNCSIPTVKSSQPAHGCYSNNPSPYDRIHCTCSIDLDLDLRYFDSREQCGPAHYTCSISPNFCHSADNNEHSARFYYTCNKNRYFPF